jgi:hypothetical protein
MIAGSMSEFRSITVKTKLDAPLIRCIYQIKVDDWWRRSLSAKSRHYTIAIVITGNEDWLANSG